MDRELNLRGVVIFALAVLTVIALIVVIDDEPAPLGVNTAGATTTTIAGATTTTVPGATDSTGSGPTSTTKPGTTPTTSFDPAGRPTLDMGDSGSDVIFLQEQLIRLKYLTGTPDGSFGQQTKDAVVKFQTDKKVTPADGVVGPSTWTALASA